VIEEKEPQQELHQDKDDDDDDDDDDDESESEEVIQQSSKQAQSFGDVMRAKIMEARMKYDPKKPEGTSKQNKKSSKSDAPLESKPKMKKLSFKRGPSNETSDSIPLPRRKFAVSESKVLEKLAGFKKDLAGPVTTEDDEWKSHSLVFEKESRVIDPMMRKDEQYEVLDPLRNSRMKEKTWHERRLDVGSKKSEKW